MCTLRCRGSLFKTLTLMLATSHTRTRLWTWLPSSLCSAVCVRRDISCGLCADQILASAKDCENSTYVKHALAVLSGVPVLCQVLPLFCISQIFCFSFQTVGVQRQICFII